MIKRAKLSTVEEVRQEKRRRGKPVLTVGHEQLIQVLANLAVAAHLNKHKPVPKRKTQRGGMS